MIDPTIGNIIPRNNGIHMGSWITCNLSGLHNTKGGGDVEGGGTEGVVLVVDGSVGVGAVVVDDGITFVTAGDFLTVYRIVGDFNVFPECFLREAGLWLPMILVVGERVTRNVGEDDDFISIGMGERVCDNIGVVVELWESNVVVVVVDSVLVPDANDIINTKKCNDFNKIWWVIIWSGRIGPWMIVYWIR